jgi:hypothetical protein
MEAAGIEPANDSDRVSGSSGRWGAEPTTRTRPDAGNDAHREWIRPGASVVDAAEAYGEGFRLSARKVRECREPQGLECVMATGEPNGAPDVQDIAKLLSEGG